MNDVALLVIAKQPVPGRVKTRLSPPFTLRQAAAMARAALLDTLDVVALTPARRKVLVFDGDPHGWTPPGFEVIAQQGRDLAERLAAAFAAVEGPALLVGMDTPQLTQRLLRAGVAALGDPDVDAVIGPAYDGGYWSIGLSRPTPDVFREVPMSVPGTFAQQKARMTELGLSVRVQPPLVDVDTAADTVVVARQAPQTRFAAAVRRAADQLAGDTKEPLMATGS